MPTSRSPIEIRQLMTRDLLSLASEETLATAAREMRLSRIRHIPVVENGQLVGVISERDVHNLSDEELLAPVSDRMHEEVQTALPETPAHEVALLMLRRAVGCVPITDGDGQLVGIVTDTDFVRAAYSLLGGTVPVDEIESEEREADSV